MTREEAKNKIQKTADECLSPQDIKELLEAVEVLEQEPYFWEKCPYYEPDIMFDEKDEYDMGKCTYKQEPCEDAISRQAVLDAICKICAVETKPSECKYKKGLFGGCIEYEAIKVIPSAEPKTGHWIMDRQRETRQCDKCMTVYRWSFNPHNYCPNCGADMKEGEA